MKRLLFLLVFCVQAYSAVRISGTIPNPILPAQTIQFTSNAVTPQWTITGLGSISSLGLYTAPTSFPPAPLGSRGTPVIVSLTDLNNNQSTSIALYLPSGSTLTIAPISIILTPGATQLFTTNAINPTWSVDIGSIDTNGNYTAPTDKSAYQLQYTPNILTANVHVSASGFDATAIATIVFPPQTPNEQTFTQFLSTWHGSTALTTLGTVSTGAIPATLLTGQLSINQLPSSIPLTFISGLPLSFTIDTTNASNITSGTLSLSRLPPIPVSQIIGINSTGSVDTTNASNITSGILNPARLPTPSLTTIGGVKAKNFATHQVLTSIASDGSVGQLQLSAGDITGLATSATTDTTNASNIITGTIAIGLLPSIPNNKVLGLASSALTDTTNATNITSGTLNVSRLPTNISVSSITGLATSATTDTTNATNITSGILGAARLPTPTNSTLGGILSSNFTIHQFVTYVDGTGLVHLAQPTVADIGGLAASATVDTTNAANITSGTLHLASYTFVNLLALSPLVVRNGDIMYCSDCDAPFFTGSGSGRTETLGGDCTSGTRGSPGDNVLNKVGAEAHRTRSTWICY